MLSHTPPSATGKPLELYLVLAYWQNVVERNNLMDKKLLFAIYTAVTFLFKEMHSLDIPTEK